MTKDLLTVQTEAGITVWDVCRKKGIMKAKEDEKLDILLNRFIKQKKHQALVFNKKKQFIGIVTLEDIIEEILKIEIVDELDRIHDMREHSERKRNSSRSK